MFFGLQTFRPNKRFTAGTIRYSLHKQAQASLNSGINLRQVVRLPEGENMNDWLAVHGALIRKLHSYGDESSRTIQRRLPPNIV